MSWTRGLATQRLFPRFFRLNATENRSLSTLGPHVEDCYAVPDHLWSMFRAATFHTHTCHLNANKTSIVRYGRQKYERIYPVLLVRPDGSTINIRYREPRRILMMPVDLSTLSEEERKSRQKKREVKKTTRQTMDNDEDNFKADDYQQFWKKLPRS